MNALGRSGFTIVEVLVAVVVLSIGVIALMGSTAMTTRMIGQGRRTTMAMEVATRRLETLRAIANTTSPPCTAGAFASGGPITTDGVTETWIVPNAGTARAVNTIVTYARAGGTYTDTLQTVIRCE
jgi:prepilin-type N-terminal cleavage/methylation domain-containing protein